MVIEFNKFGQYGNNYGVQVGRDASKKIQPEKQEDVKKIIQTDVEFKGLEDETDLLTKNIQNIYGVHLTKSSVSDKEIAEETNAILASLGYDNYKVTPAHVASVSAGLNNTILPVLKTVEDGVVASHIEDPNGPFADLFAK